MALYLSELNMVGHMDEENGVLVTPYYKAVHAHNMYLQLAFDFGMPIGIMFIGYLLLNIIRLCKAAFCTKVCGYIGLFLVLVNVCAFGLFEMMWENGYMAFSLLFLTTCIMIGEDKSKCNIVGEEI